MNWFFASTTSPYPFIDRLASNAGSRPTTDLWWCLDICSEKCWCYSAALTHCQIEWSRWEHTEWYSVNLLRAMGFHKIRVSTVFNGIFLSRASADATRTKNVDRIVVQFNSFSCRDTDDMSRVKIIIVITNAKSKNRLQTSLPGACPALMFSLACYLLFVCGLYLLDIVFHE